MEKLLSRRSLLKAMGIVAIGAPLMSACAPKETAAPAASAPSTGSQQACRPGRPGQGRGLDRRVDHRWSPLAERSL